MESPNGKLWVLLPGVCIWCGAGVVVGGGVWWLGFIAVGCLCCGVGVVGWIYVGGGLWLGWSFGGGGMIWYWSAGGSSVYDVLSGVYACGSVGLCGVLVVYVGGGLWLG
jgi:hypothetical protein